MMKIKILLNFSLKWAERLCCCVSLVEEVWRHRQDTKWNAPLLWLNDRFLCFMEERFIVRVSSSVCLFHIRVNKFLFVCLFVCFCFHQLIDLSSPLIKWSPDDKKENNFPLINLSLWPTQQQHQHQQQHHQQQLVYVFKWFLCRCSIINKCCKCWFLFVYLLLNSTTTTRFKCLFNLLQTFMLFYHHISVFI